MREASHYVAYDLPLHSPKSRDSLLSPMSSDTKKLPVYELVYHALPTLAEGEIATYVESLRNRIRECGASILSEEGPKRTTLAYRMVKPVSGKLERFDSAVTGSIRLEAEPTAAQALNESLRTDTTLLRFILTHTIRDIPAPRRAVLREIATKTFERKVVKEEVKGPMSEAALDKSLEEIVGEKL